MATKKNPTAGLVLAARAKAVSSLIAAHPDQFDAYMADECAKVGVTYTIPKSEEQIAREKIDALLAKNPSLRAEYGPLGGPVPSGLDEFAPVPA